MFATWARFIYHFRWLVVGLSVLMLPLSVMLIQAGGSLTTQSIPTRTESGRAFTLIKQQLPSTAADFTLIFQSAHLPVTSRAFRSAMARALHPIQNDPRVSGIATPYGRHGLNHQLVSRDGRGALAIVTLRPNLNSDQAAYTALHAKVHSSTLAILPAGDIPLNRAFTDTAQNDLHRAELAGLPIVLVLLLGVFGSVASAGLPIGVGILAVLGGMAGTFLLARGTDVSVYATQIVSMIGLGVAIDYSLFIVNRFREEMSRHSVQEALVRTVETAGRAIIFSGVTVAIGLLGLLFFHVGNVGSMGMAGTIVVCLAVVYALTFLPAVLAILGPRINAIRIPMLHSQRGRSDGGFWYRLSRGVMRRPWLGLLPTAAVLLLLGSPVLRLHLANGDYTVLPASSQARQGTEALARYFPGGNTDQIAVVLQYPSGSPFQPARIEGSYDLTRWLSHLPGITRVNSLATLDPSASPAKYENLASLPPSRWPPAVRRGVRRYVGAHIAVLYAYTPYRASSSASQAIVRTIRTTHPPIRGHLLVTGTAAFNIDTIGQVHKDIFGAMSFIVIATYIVLFLLLGSAILPLKAALMNILSISASYGALVWIFQDGHLSSWLDFTPGPIDPTVPILLFCILFGLSMDYEVMLLSRIKEEYGASHDTAQAIAVGLQRTGRIITGAALIMATVFFAFTIARTTIIKEIGLGLGIAVVVDAAIVRTFLVPSAMLLLGRWNWWAPRPLVRIYLRMGLAETSEEALERSSAASAGG